MRGLHVAAIVATVLVVWTAANSLRRPAPPPDLKPKKPKPTQVSHVRCTIKRAVFGGTEAAVLRIRKNRLLHYVVMDLPTDHPRMPDYQGAWLKSEYGDVGPSALVGVYPTVEEAELKAGSLCRSN